MLTPYLPYPPSSGGQIRSFNLIKYLSKKHEITLFSLVKDEKEKKDIKVLEKYCKKIRVFRRSKSPWTLRNVLLTGLGPYPFLVVRNFSTEERLAIDSELKSGKYDLIHAETFYTMPHIPKTQIPVLLVEQTIEYLVYRHFASTQPFFPLRPMLMIDVAKIRYWEKLYWKKADRVVAVSEADKKEMVKLVPKLDVKIVPNGVDLDFFRVKKNWDAKNPKILFVANFKWLQNVEAANILIDEVFPLIKKALPLSELTIVGQHVPKSLLVKGNSSVEVKSLAEKDEESIRQAYYNSSIFVSPLHGPGGTRLKHFAAMASKLPLITTPVGAEGLGAKDQKHILIRKTPRDLALAAIEVLQKPQLARDLAGNARELVEKKYSWPKMGELLDKVYMETADGK